MERKEKCFPAFSVRIFLLSILTSTDNAYDTEHFHNCFATKRREIMACKDLEKVAYNGLKS